MVLTASRLRADIYRILDEVLRTGEPVEIERSGKLLKIVPVDPPESHSTGGRPSIIVGDPEDLAGISWEDSWKP